MMRRAVQQFEDVRSSNNDKYFESEEESLKKEWKHHEPELRHYG